MAKVALSQVQKMIILLNSGQTMKQIATTLGVTALYVFTTLNKKAPTAAQLKNLT